MRQVERGRRCTCTRVALSTPSKVLGGRQTEGGVVFGVQDGLSVSSGNGYISEVLDSCLLEAFSKCLLYLLNVLARAYHWAVYPFFPCFVSKLGNGGI